MADTSLFTVEKLYSFYQEFPIVTTDSRKIPPNSIFFALKGNHFDGNKFATQALEKGAAIAVVDDPTIAKGDPYFLVDDVLHSLQQLSLLHRKRFDIPVIGITGSNGKTTTKELIHAVLCSKYKTLSTAGNLNNHIGVPLTLLSIQPETEIAVVEMGANHPGEIAFLCELARPTYGLITNIGRAHLEGFGGFEGVVRTKTELYAFLKNHAGEVFLNAEDQMLSNHAGQLTAITYGLIPDAGTSGRIVFEEAVPADGKIAVDITFPDDEKQRIRSGLFGSYNALNLLAAAAAGFHFEVPVRDIVSALETYTPSNNRSQLQRTSHNLLVLDAYNANPNSMVVAIEDFNRTFEIGKVLILGDMLELGQASEQEHLAILKRIEKLKINEVFLVGPIFKAVNTNQNWVSFENSPEALKWLQKHPIKDATILLKGSRGIQLEKIAACL